MIAIRVQNMLKAFVSCIFIYAFCTGLAFSQTSPAITDPPNGSVLKGTTQTFTWSKAGATTYIYVGSSVGASDFGAVSAASTATTATITGLPTNGGKLYVRMYSNIGGVWYANDTTYYAYSPNPTPAKMSSPSIGSMLAGSTQTFTWNDAGAVGYNYVVVVGSNGAGADDLGYYLTPGTSTTISRLPTDGRMLYVRLYSFIGGAYQVRDFTYTAFLSTSPGAASVTPW
ncbi:MAG: hypothetical protein V4568_18385 [Pseudomonadota bacterium]